ncbi:DUF4270 family protein [Chitinophaga defluvii]|uniref:DUF4270 family protein n=1 Tax=Chitinophaga defluvii TaxID=3163343 RepID=A0ABV2TCN4_9BACT
MNSTMHRLMNTIYTHRRSRYLLYALLATTATSCEKKGFTYDNIIATPDETNYTITDTLTVDMRTIQLDSVITSNQATLLIGQKQDPSFGKITAGTFFQLKLPANTLETKALYDSLELLIKPNGFVYGDSTTTQEIQVFPVLEKIQPSTDNYYLYNTSNFATGSTTLGTFNGIIRPNVDTLLHIKMSDAKGAEIFDLFKNKADEVSSQNNFQEYLQGLALQAGTNSTLVNGFQGSESTVIMRLHYHLDGLDVEKKYIDFTLYNPQVQFNRIQADRTGTALSSLAPGVDGLLSDATGNSTFIQAITGVVTRIDIPYLKSLPAVSKYFKLIQASLVVAPIAGTYNDYQLPYRLTLCAANNKNMVTDTLPDPVNGYAQYGNLVIDNMLHEKTAYTYDITRYCINEINSTNYTTRGLVLIPSAYDARTRLDRTIIGDQKNKTNRIKIQVYYLSYK